MSHVAAVVEWLARFTRVQDSPNQGGGNFFYLHVDVGISLITDAGDGV